MGTLSDPIVFIAAGLISIFGIGITLRSVFFQDTKIGKEKLRHLSAAMVSVAAMLAVTSFVFSSDIFNRPYKFSKSEAMNSIIITDYMLKSLKEACAVASSPTITDKRVINFSTKELNNAEILIEGDRVIIKSKSFALLARLDYPTTPDSCLNDLVSLTVSAQRARIE